ncbi:serine protease 3-like [Anticarsia gemmatalis]|uniref:serine protease 3-like n=1 Tax=Anticarsia gemmatalis TaxID=129554 RepID=UPI003F763709
MLMKTGLIVLLAAVLQVSTELVEPEFIEDVMKREAESSSTRIVSGWEALPGQHPHQAALRMVAADGGVSACGGSFVHRNWLLTSAHCTAQRVTLVVRGGVVSLTTPEYIYETTEWWNYPTYDDNDVGTVQPDDISIVKLQRPVTYTRYLKAIRIQPSADAFRNYDGEVVHASGHGRTWTGGSSPENLRWVFLRAVANPTCAQTFGSALITANAICARWFNVTSQSTCQGDSGGPLVHVSDGVETLIGVTSFVAGGNFGCHSGLPAGFIRPGPFLPWFKEITGIDFENFDEDDDEPTEPTPPEDDSEEEDETSEEDTSEEDSSAEDDDSDDDISQIMKRLQVKVKVKVAINKFKVKKEVEKEKIKKHNH